MPTKCEKNINCEVCESFKKLFMYEEWASVEGKLLFSRFTSFKDAIPQGLYWEDASFCKLGHEIRIEKPLMFFRDEIARILNCSISEERMGIKIQRLYQSMGKYRLMEDGIEVKITGISINGNTICIDCSPAVQMIDVEFKKLEEAGV